MLNLLITIIAFLVALGILISVHEFGHFWVARRLGVKVLRFSIGFGKPFIRYQKNTDSTEYALAAIPLGGYVKMLDEREGEVSPEEKHLAFNTQHVSKRIAIVAAGPIFNFMLAIFLYMLVAMLGITDVKPIIGEVTPASIADKAQLQQGDSIITVAHKRVQTWTQARLAIMDAVLTDDSIELLIARDVTQVYKTLQLRGHNLLKDDQDIIENLGISTFSVAKALPYVGGIVTGSPAQIAGLRVGDLITAMDGKKTSTWNDWAHYVRARPGQKIRLSIQRSNEDIEFDIVPRAEKVGDAVIGRVGVLYQNPAMVTIQQPFLSALTHGLEKTWRMSILMFKMLGKLIVGEVSAKNISGPITIAEYAGKTASIDIRAYLDFIAIVSISLAVLNLLPIPLLDGGHLLYYCIEVVTGRGVSEKNQLIGQQIGIVILGLLMIVAFYNDINRLIN